ncbi:hypothetical protein VSH64_38905 [Amycolatopsis rhabdoformis]|uniref:Uncharacterized protein n=1 Tax=Amycolatopsis rhabdoformis TaxID=1448059 RepID=A0ABZ1I3B5_9PSEU|nr:hypothetical protein [Amycolatopsis rhabdoformis]WSE28745.1 hypothetical protein VSH64_38905 [Amycolatopsis rhabdoformis]
MPTESTEEPTPTTIPPVTTGKPPHGGGTTQPDGAFDPYDEPTTSK